MSVNEPLSIQIKFLNSKINNNVYLPNYGTEGSGGMDLRACIDKPMVLEAKQCQIIPTGIAIYIQNSNFVGLILPRSGLGHNHGIVLGNLVGLIDADYQGELKISCWNRSSQNYTIHPCDRIAQLLLIAVQAFQFNIVEEFQQQTARGAQGFGHTGNK